MNNSTRIKYFDDLVKRNKENNLRNPFSSNWEFTRSNLDSIKPKYLLLNLIYHSDINKCKKSKDDPNYGISVYEKTRKRGIDAHNQISNEVLQLIEV